MIVWRRAWMIVATVVLAVVAAGAYLYLAPRVYTAEADLLVTPVPRDDALLAGLGLIRESSDPTREVQTAARLVNTPEVAERAKTMLGLQVSTSSLLNDVRAEPVADSNIVAVTANRPSPRGARDIANAFAKSAVEIGDERLRRTVSDLIERLLNQTRTIPPVARSGPDSIGASLARRIARLELVRADGDQTIRVLSLARAPDEPSSPQPALTVAAAIVAGLVLGLGAVLVLQSVRPQSVRPRSPVSGPVTEPMPLPEDTPTPQERQSPEGPEKEASRPPNVRL